MESPHRCWRVQGKARKMMYTPRFRRVGRDMYSHTVQLLCASEAHSHIFTIHRWPAAGVVHHHSILPSCQFPCVVRSLITHVIVAYSSSRRLQPYDYACQRKTCREAHMIYESPGGTASPSAHDELDRSTLIEHSTIDYPTVTAGEESTEPMPYVAPTTVPDSSPAI
jgi:hypothetical protein